MNTRVPVKGIDGGFDEIPRVDSHLQIIVFQAVSVDEVPSPLTTTFCTEPPYSSTRTGMGF